MINLLKALPLLLVSTSISLSATNNDAFENTNELSKSYLSTVPPGHICAVKADGTAKCWGNNEFTQSYIPLHLGSESAEEPLQRSILPYMVTVTVFVTACIFYHFTVHLTPIGTPANLPSVGLAYFDMP